MTRTRTSALPRFTLLAALVAACGPSNAGDDAGSGDDAAALPDAVNADADQSYLTDDDGDGYSEVMGDCNDHDEHINPAATEICDDQIDNNCNGATDLSEPDQDGDGYGPCQGDCDDEDENVNPGAEEVPDTIDNDCDGLVDADYDSDGFTVADGDCNDNDPDVYPGAQEDCYDGKDNDCNSYADQAEPDTDGDGYGPCSGDCDDGNIDIGPDSPEIDGDGIDNNCDNLVDEDIDGDGWTVANGDCADDDPTRNPAVTEVCGDGIDNNCSGDETDCLTDCEIAELTKSNVGCTYYAVDMDNDNNSAFQACFAVIVSNTDATKTANVQVDRWVSGLPVPLTFPGYTDTRAIPPGGLEVFRIAGSCSAPGSAVSGDAGIDGTGLATRNAFRIRSDLPVVAYQINPYEAALEHTTDASLLIASSALDRYHYVIAYPQTNPARGSWDLRSAINIIGTADGTSVTITSSTSTRAGGVVPALSPSQVWATTINEGDNLQIETLTTNNDLTGTYIESSAPVAVFGGNECADIPIYMGYCDHLEEQLTPLTTWGTEYVAARHPPRASESVIWRVVAASNATTITFDPAVHANLVLDAGEVAEFSTSSDFVARSTDPSKPFFMVQFMVGAEQTASESGTDIYTLGNLRGDPAMTISVPTAQYLDSYGFLSDSTYAYNWLVVARSDSSDQIHLDCWDPIPNAAFNTVGAGPYQVARVRLSAESGGVDGSCTSGAHRIWGDGPFGIWVYGVYSDTSYGYPGGMSLERIFSVE